MTSTTSRRWIINVNIVIFCTDWLFYKRLLENFPIYFYMIFTFNQIAFYKSNIIISRKVTNCLVPRYNITTVLLLLRTFSLEQRLQRNLTMDDVLVFWGRAGLRCCRRAFSSCSRQGLLSVAMHRLLPAAAPPVAEHRLRVCML